MEAWSYHHAQFDSSHLHGLWKKANITDFRHIWMTHARMHFHISQKISTRLEIQNWYKNEYTQQTSVKQQHYSLHAKD